MSMMCVAKGVMSGLVSLGCPLNRVDLLRYTNSRLLLSLHALSNVKLVLPPIACAAVGGAAILTTGYWLLYRPYEVREIWKQVATTDDTLGEWVLDEDGEEALPLQPKPLEPNIAAMLDHSIGLAEHWRTQLFKFLSDLGMDGRWMTYIRARYARDTGRRRVDQALLKQRDTIFAVRNLVLTKVTRTAIQGHTAMDRLVVARAVEEAFATFKIRMNIRGMIREACINACFVATMFDEGGERMTLGPSRRPI